MSNALQNRMMQLLTDLTKAAGFAKLVFEMIASQGEN
jgi:hypothetical protein